MSVHPVYADTDAVLDPARMKADLEKFLATTNVPGLAAEIRVGGRQCGVAIGRPALSARNHLIDRSRFRISCAIKMFVSTVCAWLAESGKIDMAAPIGTYLPELGTSHHSKGGTITITHLLSHTSGYRGLDLRDNGARSDWSWRDCVDYLSTTPQFFQPGFVFNEENLDYVIAGEIIRRVTQRKVADLIKEIVFDPLGLTPSTAAADVDTPDERVFGHLPNPNVGGIEPVIATGAPNELWSSALSAVTMSAHDMAAFAAELIQPEHLPGVLSADVRHTMLRDEIALPPTYSIRQGRSWVPAAFTPGCAKFANGFYGYFGVGRGFSCAIVANPETGISLGLGLNVAAGPLRSFILDYLLSFAKGTPRMEIGRGIPLEMIDLGYDEFMAPFQERQLVGQYAGNARDGITVALFDGSVVVSLGQKMTITLRPDQNGRLKVETDFPIPIAFFPEPSSGTPCLMLGMAAYKKIG